MNKMENTLKCKRSEMIDAPTMQCAVNALMCLPNSRRPVLFWAGTPAQPLACLGHRITFPGHTQATQQAQTAQTAQTAACSESNHRPTSLSPCKKASSAHRLHPICTRPAPPCNGSFRSHHRVSGDGAQQSRKFQQLQRWQE